MFTGTIVIDQLFDLNESRRGAAATETFEPGARTAWHMHPFGQTTIILSGLGWVQREGEPVYEVRPGDLVWFEAGKKHWHGAKSTHVMSHIAIQEKLGR